MSVDLLSDVLRAVRLDGAYFYKVEASDPWCVEAGPALASEPRILPESEHLIAYHVLVEGRCYGGPLGAELRELRPGDVIVFPHGVPHRMSYSADPSVVADLAGVPQGARMPLQVTMGGGGRRSTLVCGFLGCDRRPFNPLLAALPEVLVFREAEATRVGSSLAAFRTQVIEEVQRGRSGGELLLTRLAELMFIEVVRRHIESLPNDQTGWLAGLRDEVVGRALGLLHERPAKPWSLEELARAVACSRSVLAERFTRLVGEPPMQYLTRWRLQLASRQLANSAAKVTSIAREVGYDSESAFSRAFKRELGVSPAVWRARRAKTV